MKVNKRIKQYRDDKKLAFIGENIKKYRKLKNLTQIDLALLCEDVDWSQISRMERGKVNFSISYLFLIAEVLEITPNQLLKVD